MTLKSIPLSVKILVGLFLGIAVGLVWQAQVQLVDKLAQAFLLLLQMTALPYIMLSLIVGIGGLSPTKAKRALYYSTMAIVALIAIVLLFIFITPIAFPDWENADFYSVNTIKTNAEVDLVSLFIPANPFNALTQAIIPSIVLFSFFIGIGLMTVRYKRRAILVVGSLLQSVANINGIVMQLAPIGVFCIGWRAAVTIDSSQVDGLVVYFASAIFIVVMLALVVLPVLTAIITPYRYRDVIKASRSAMITAFATGSFLVVIPLIVEKIKQLSAKNSNMHDDSETVAEILVPITFSLPVGGKLLALLFVLFAAWFSGAHVSVGDYFNLAFAGLPQLFGTSTIAMPFLLELFNVPSSMFDMFIISENLLVGRLSTILSVSFAVSLPLIIASALQHQLTLKWRHLVRNVLIIPTLTIAILFVLRFSFDAISHQYQGYEKFINRDFILAPVSSKTITDPKLPTSYNKEYRSALERIQHRGILRVGYFRDDLPYSFHNKQGKLVGFDIEILNQLAIDLGVSIEFVRIFHTQAAPLLANGYLDITSGIPVIPDNMTKYTMTIPYSKQTVAFIVKDFRRNEFLEWSKITDNEKLTIGIPETFFYKTAVTRAFQKGKAWEISTPRLFFKEEYQHIDGMLFGAAAASAWTLLYPDYTVVVPRPALEPLSMAFPIAKNDQEFELFMRNWITMKQQSGTIDKLFNYWIAGKNDEN
ncbi:cation:dicarboxylate symporter family transporter [Thalassotalea fusca]